MRKQQGFTLLEAVIAIVLTGSVAAILFLGVADLTDRTQRQKNETFTQIMANALKRHYNSFAFEVEQNANGIYSVPSQGINIPNGELTSNVKDSLNKVTKTVSMPNVSFLDGYNQPMLLLISNRLEKNYQGVLIPYRVIAVVSNNDGKYVNGRPEFNTTMNLNTGELVIDPEEMVSTVNTYSAQVNKFIESKDRIDTIATAYSQFYWSRYNMTLGDRGTDYFASGSGYWDSGTGIRKSCGYSPSQVSGYNTPGVNINTIGLDVELNIGTTNYQDAWGQNFYIMNCGTIGNVRLGNTTTTLAPRNPDNPSRNSHPFNAIIGMTLGNGQSYIKTIVARM